MSRRLTLRPSGSLSDLSVRRRLLVQTGGPDRRGACRDPDGRERLEPPPAPPAPAAAPVLAEDALPTSLDELNRRGYLKDAFFDFDRAEIASPSARPARRGREPGCARIPRP